MFLRTRKTIAIVTAIVLAGFAVLANSTAFASPSGGSSLILTGVYDGPLTGGTPKGVEICATADIADLSIYGIGSANNGGGTDGEEFTFSGSATKGQSIFVTSNAGQFNAFFGIDSTFTTGFMEVNGDDAIELFVNGVVADVYGEIDVDGNGDPWEYLDGWAYRVDGTGPDGSTWTETNWTYSGVNGLEGGTTNDTADVPFPLMQYSACIPMLESTVPEEGATAVALDTTITINASENMFVGTDSALATIDCGMGNETYTVSGDGTAAIVITPDEDLPDGANCAVTVFGSELTDSNGNEIVVTARDDITLNFATMASTAVGMQSQNIDRNMSATMIVVVAILSLFTVAAVSKRAEQ